MALLKVKKIRNFFREKMIVPFFRKKQIQKVADEKTAELPETPNFVKTTGVQKVVAKKTVIKPKSESKFSVKLGADGSLTFETCIGAVSSAENLYTFKRHCGNNIETALNLISNTLAQLEKSKIGNLTPEEKNSLAFARAKIKLFREHIDDYQRR